MNSPFHYFSDPVLRGPTIGCMLMCLASSLVGTLTFIKRRSLLGESLAHASYPGVILAVILLASLGGAVTEGEMAVAILGGAFVSSLLGLYIIDLLQHRLKVSSDAALCFVLSSFFGVGITMASRMQFTHTELYKQIQSYLYGQAATMTDVHIYIYLALSLFIIAIIILFYRQFQISSFDRDFARSIGIRLASIDFLILLLAVVAIVVGIRSVGFVLVSAMLIAPAAAARQFTHKLHRIFLLAAFFGVISGFLGNYLSVEVAHQMGKGVSGRELVLPTGPMIVLVATSICLLSLFFAPERGAVYRLLRVARFRWSCVQENLLKAMWRCDEGETVAFDWFDSHERMPRFLLRFLIGSMVRNGWVKKIENGEYRLTSAGQKRGANIVRVHRLWELFLVTDLGLKAERVHRNAEQMEHVITPELERRLTELLDDPKTDPHQQPIPESQEEDSGGKGL